ncbi:MAG: GSCFA domain-containing protein [Kiloniellales bacterium]
MDHPYQSQPQKAFWKLGVAEAGHVGAIQNLWLPKFTIEKSDVFITAGSCFAQHIRNAIVERGFNWFNAEPAPPNLTHDAARENGYDVYSFRTGNIYSPALLRQWIDWAFDGTPDCAEAWVDDVGRVTDPYRPNVEACPFGSIEELEALREQTLAAIRTAVAKASIFVFTLGQTEIWTNRETEHVYPMCPGTIAGTFDPNRHTLRVMRYSDIMRDMSAVIERLYAVNPELKFLLTVSPVPTTATATDQHVLVASTNAKAALRAAATDLREDYPNVDYFPSFEIIATHPSRGRFYDANLRTVTDNGVKLVMRHLLAGIRGKPIGFKAPNKAEGPAKSGLSNESQTTVNPNSSKGGGDKMDPVCEEMMLEKFAKGGRS